MIDLRRTIRFLAGLLLCICCLGSDAAAQDHFNVWLNNKVREIAAARINQRSNTNQTEAPSMSSNSTSLVDQSSVADLLGVALNLAELSGASIDDKEVTSASVSVTAYALYAGFKGVDPLDPSFYSKHGNWRKFSVTLGYDKEKDTSGGMNDRATLVGAKYLLVNRRDASHPNHLKECNPPVPGKKCGPLGIVSDQLQSATGAFAALTPQIEDYLFEQLKAKYGEDKFTFLKNRVGNPAAFQALLQELGDKGMQEINKMIEAQIDPFVDLKASSIEAVEAIRRAPQLSFASLSKLRRHGADEYMAEFIFDYGLHPRINWTANASFEFKDNPLGRDIRGGKFASQFQFQLSPESKLAGRKPLGFGLAAEANWMTGTRPTYKGQAKFSIPILDGIDFPLSLTFASRTDLVNEKEVRGQFGFTIDLSRLLAAAK